ncbi:MAG TPA: hypothetical protein VGL57_00305 [Solirubrobacteraceae bacterium]
MLLAAVVLSAAATQAASAAWYVNGTVLTGTAALATTASVAEHVKLKAGGVTVECTVSTLTTAGGEIKSPNKLAASKITFNECKGSGSCTVPSSIATVPVTAELTEQSLQDTATFTPQSGTLFATIKYEGATCALAGTQPLTGKMTAKLPSGEEEETLQEVKANILEKSGELKLGSSAAEFKGAALLKLGQ